MTIRCHDCGTKRSHQTATWTSTGWRCYWCQAAGYRRALLAMGETPKQATDTVRRHLKALLGLEAELAEWRR